MHKNIHIFGNDATASALVLLAELAGHTVWHHRVAQSLKAPAVLSDFAQKPPKNAAADWVVSRDGNCTPASIRQKPLHLSYLQLLLRLKPLPVIFVAGTRGKSGVAHLLQKLIAKTHPHVLVGRADAKSLLAHPQLHSARLLLLTGEAETLQALDFVTPLLLVWLNRLKKDVPAGFVRLLRKAAQKNAIVYSADDENIARILNRNEIVTKGKYFSAGFACGKEIVIPGESKINFWGNLENTAPQTFSLPHFRGDYQTANAAAACVAARFLSVSDTQIRRTLATYAGMPNRVEYLGRINSISFVNNAAAYGEISSYEALRACPTAVVWITNDTTALLSAALCRLVCQKVRSIVCIGGKHSGNIEKSLGELIYSFHRAENMNQAIDLAYLLAEKDDTVLFSPLHTSKRTEAALERLGNHFRKPGETYLRNIRERIKKYHLSERKIA